MNLQHAIEEWRNYVRLELGQSKITVLHRTSKLRHFQKFLFEKYGLTDPAVEAINLSQFRGFVEYLIDGRQVGAVTVRTYLEALRSLYAYLKEYEYVLESPIHRLKMPKRTPPKRELVSDEEERRMFSACELLRPQFRAKMAAAILALYCYGGLRTKEVLSLSLTDIVFEREDCFVQVTYGKGGKRRVVPLHREAISYLLAYLTERAGKAGQSLWLVDSKRPLSMRGLSTLFRDVKWFARIDRPGVKLHCLRHKYATRKLRAGVNLYTIKELLGHADIQTTVKYLHSDLVQLTEAAQKGGLFEEKVLGSS